MLPKKIKSPLDCTTRLEMEYVIQKIKLECISREEQKRLKNRGILKLLRLRKKVNLQRQHYQMLKAKVLLATLGE